MSDTARATGKAKILLLTLVFRPDGVSTSYIMTELARELRKLGHQLVVITTTPHYNEDRDALAAQPLRRKWGSMVQESHCDDIPVYHVKVGRKGSRVLQRVFDYLLFHAIGTIAAVRLGGNYDVVIAASPPLTIGLSGLMVAAYRRVPFVYNVQEIFPDSLVRIGVLKNKLVIRVFEWIERFIYRASAKVVVISESFRNQLLAKNVPDSKIELISNFVDLDLIQPYERHNAFSAEHGLDEKFVVSYAGNIGLTQDFESILDAAKRLRDTAQVQILIVGDGARRDWLAREIVAQKVTNLTLLPYQPKSVVPFIYASSDLCLVPLRAGSALGTFPSKIYTIMGSARPVLVSADSGSDLCDLTEAARCGFVVSPSDPEQLAGGIRSAFAARETLLQLGRNGREFVLQRYSAPSVAQQYSDLVSRLVPSRAVVEAVRPL
jgi:colanic acid biosynthesis glycosyl transferase WcaI